MRRRLPVQHVIRPGTPDLPDYRGYAGQIAPGSLRVGEEVVVLPSGTAGTIAGIDLPGEPVGAASARRSVTLLLDDDVDIARGDLIVPAADVPLLTRDVRATVCHVADRPLTAGHLSCGVRSDRAPHVATCRQRVPESAMVIVAEVRPEREP